jgi:hypothetical protein
MEKPFDISVYVLDGDKDRYFDTMPFTDFVGRRGSDDEIIDSANSAAVDAAEKKYEIDLSKAAKKYEWICITDEVELFVLGIKRGSDPKTEATGQYLLTPSIYGMTRPDNLLSSIYVAHANKSPLLTKSMVDLFNEHSTKKIELPK